MVLCYVPSCKNRSDYRNWKKNINKKNHPKITFHSFPKNDTIRNMWSDILGINPTSIPAGARICSVHFEEKFFDRTSVLITRLRPNALPHNESGMETFSFSNLSMATKTGKLSAVDSITEILEEVDKLSILKKDNSEDLMHKVLTSQMPLHVRIVLIIYYLRVNKKLVLNLHCRKHTIIYLSFNELTRSKTIFPYFYDKR